jgi:hypothetical protein
VSTTEQTNDREVVHTFLPILISCPISESEGEPFFAPKSGSGIRYFSSKDRQAALATATPEQRKEWDMVQAFRDAMESGDERELKRAYRLWIHERTKGKAVTVERRGSGYVFEITDNPARGRLAHLRKQGGRSDDRDVLAAIMTEISIDPEHGTFVGVQQRLSRLLADASSRVQLVAWFPKAGPRSLTPALYAPDLFSAEMAYAVFDLCRVLENESVCIRCGKKFRRRKFTKELCRPCSKIVSNKNWRNASPKNREKQRAYNRKSEAKRRRKKRSQSKSKHSNRRVR